MTKKNSQNAFNVEYAVMCESVSKEMTGKDILIGVVPYGVAARTFPMNLLCAFWCVVEAFKPIAGLHKLKLVMQEKNKPEKKLADWEFGFKIPDGAAGKNSFGTPPINLILKEPMTAELMWSVDDSPLKHLRDCHFIKLPDNNEM